jgi:hypothetical protein
MTSATEAIAAAMNGTETSRSSEGMSASQKIGSVAIRNELGEKHNPFRYMDKSEVHPTFS